MSTRSFTIVLALLLTACSGTARGATGIMAPAPVPDEVILKFRPGANAGERDRLLADLGARRAIPLGRTGALLVELSAPTADAAVASHAGNATLAYIEPNFRYRSALIPDDDLFPQQWSLLNTGQTGGTPGADVRATAAWDLGTGLWSVVIAVLDSGLDRTHPDLVDNLFVNTGEIPDNGLDDDGNGYIDDVCGWDFVNDDNDPQDDNGHGTFVAGIAGATGNNGIGVTGVCWRVSLLPLKFLDENGSGTTADAVLALDYAVAMGAGITNNAWGGGPFSRALLDAILLAEDAGVVFVTSAGASSSDLDKNPAYPASYAAANVLAVAATDHDDLLASSSNFGLETVDLAAPGVNIPTTRLGGTWQIVSGTSAACAYVAGALGLLQARFPLATGTAAAEHLLANTEKIPALTDLVRTGRLDAYAPLVQAPSAVGEDGEFGAAPGGRLRLWPKSVRDGEVRLGLYLPSGEHGRMTVFDLRGRRIRDLRPGPLAPGFHVVVWDTRSGGGERTPSGVYFVRFEGRSAKTVTRLVLRR